MAYVQRLAESDHFYKTSLKQPWLYFGYLNTNFVHLICFTLIPYDLITLPKLAITTLTNPTLAKLLFIKPYSHEVEKLSPYNVCNNRDDIKL